MLGHKTPKGIFDAPHVVFLNLTLEYRTSDTMGVDSRLFFNRIDRAVLQLLLSHLSATAKQRQVEGLLMGCGPSNQLE